MHFHNLQSNKIIPLKVILLSLIKNVINIVLKTKSQHTE